MTGTYTPPSVRIGDLVRVVNVDPTRIFRGCWDLVDYVIAPGAEDYMPFEAMKVFFGDPRSTKVTRSMRDSRGIVAFLPDRSSEIRRLRLLYDHGFGDYTGAEGASVVWEQSKIPHVEVYTMKGERIYTVIDDPQGSTILPATATVADEHHLREVVEEQGKLIKSLMDRIGMDDVADIGLPGKNVYHVTTDTIEPPTVPPPSDIEVYEDLPEDRG